MLQKKEEDRFKECTQALLNLESKGEQTSFQNDILYMKLCLKIQNKPLFKKTPFRLYVPWVTNAQEKCVICTDNFMYGELILTLPDCSHVFHRICILTWYINNINCPLCRVPI